MEKHLKQFRYNPTPPTFLMKMSYPNAYLLADDSQLSLMSIPVFLSLGFRLKNTTEHDENSPLNIPWVIHT